jgi:protein TonB
MTKFRYSFSLIISSILYTALGFLVINFLDAKKTITKPKKNIIKISLITPLPKVIIPPKPLPLISPIIVPPKKIEKPKIIKKPKPKKKIKKKRVVKKKIVRKRKIIKKKIIKKVVKKTRPKKVIKRVKVVEKHPIVKKITPIVRETPIIEEVYTPVPIIKALPKIVKKPLPTYVPPPAPKVDNYARKRAFLSQVRSQIIANKRYPKIARRRHIEGAVTVKFNIGRSGNVSKIRFISGKTILQKSVKKAIKNSFPIDIPSEMKGELPINNISVTINFSIN